MKTVTARDNKSSRNSARTPRKPNRSVRPLHSTAQQSEVRNIISPPVIQKKVVIGPASDHYEREADAVADKVVAGQPVSSISLIGSSSIAPTVQPAPEEETPIQRQAEDELVEEEQIQTKLVQRQSDEEPEEEEPVQAMLVQRQSEEEPEEDEPVQAMLIQRQPDEEPEEEEPVQARRNGTPGSSRAAMNSAAASAIQSKGAGIPIIPSTRHKLESSMGVDLQSVRVHEDSTAKHASRTMKARAFTHGSDIWLGSGESQGDIHLMAHESTHVLQQDGVVRRAPVEATAEVEDEIETDAAEATSSIATAEPTQQSVPTAPAPPTAEEAPAKNATASDEISTSEGDAGGNEGGGSDNVELLMPAPPTELSDAAQGRLQGVQENAAEAATAEEELPGADENVDSARGAVTEPTEETAARVQADVVAALGEDAAPSPEIEELCQRIYEVIRSKRPPDEDSLVDADPEAMANEAGGELNSTIEGDTDRVAGSYDGLDNPPAGSPASTPEAMTEPPEEVTTPDINASDAVPDTVPAEDVSLDADVASSQARMDNAGMSTDVAAVIQDPSNPVVQARETQGELEATAGPGPAEVMAQQEAARAQAATDMVALQEQALQALSESRGNTITGNSEQRQQMVGTEEQMRTQASNEAQQIYNDARTRVTELLNPLTRNAMQRWNTEKEVLAGQFERKLKRVKDWIDERHSGVGGFFVSIGDAIAGLPDWVTEEYDDAEKEFGDGVTSLIREISTEVNRVVAICEAIIADADRRIEELFNSLPDSLRDWAEGERARFGEQLENLSNNVRETRDNFNRDLTQRASQAVQDVRQQIHELRQAARGLIGKIADAIDAFLDDPVKFIIEGILSLLGIPPASFWAVVNKIRNAINDIADDPESFANNLMDAIGQGFKQFFDHIVDHLLGGFIDWLFSGLGAVGVQIPSDFSLKSIITFFLELMGITWPRIRRLLAKHIGEENVALLERAYAIISDLIAMGPEGIFEMIKDQLNPQNILDMVIQAAIDFMIEAALKAATVRIAMLFNPVGAIAQAIEAIYRVVSWIFENAARIFSLIETIVNGITDIIAGNIGGMANAIETALARLIAPVIDFVAGYVGMGDLPEKIADVIKGFQEWIEGILDRVIGWLADRAKALLRSLGLGGEDGEAGAAEYDGQIGKVVTWTADGESHRMWIVKEGNNAVVKMRSVEKPVTQYLDEYTRMANDLPEDKKADVTNLIGQARQILADLDSDADQLAQQTNNPEQNPQDIQAKDNEVESEEGQLKSLLKRIRESLGIEDNFGSRENPLPIDWPKRASSEYPTLYFGPKTQYVSQDTLREHSGEEYMGTTVEEYNPHSRKPLPDGGPTIGVTSQWQISTGTKIKLNPGRTKGGGRINKALKPYGYSPRKEGYDGDHVTEMQVGGQDRLENLWPLDKGENRSAGSLIANKVFDKPDGSTITMRQLKDETKRREIWLIINSTK